MVVVAGLSDDSAALGVSDQDGRAILHVEDLTGCGDVPLEGQGRVLHNADPVPVGSEQIVDLPPTGSIYKTAVTSTTLRTGALAFMTTTASPYRTR
jgi:hypothetical protein